LLKVRGLSKVLLSAGLLVSVSTVGTHASTVTHIKKQVVTVSKNTRHNVSSSKIACQPIVPYNEAQRIFQIHGKK
jgi:hypothetical protein